MITGAGRGLGLNLAYAILEIGADVCCLDVLQEPDSEEWATAKKIAGARNLHISYDRCDITNEAAVEQLIQAKSEEARSRGKPLRGLVNSAGIQQMEDALDYPMDGFRRMMEVNVTGSYIIAKQFARAMVAQKLGASIVLIASMSGNIANRVSISLAHRVIDQMSSGSENLTMNRVCTVQPTTPAKEQFTRCVGHWRTNGVSTGSASTPCLLATSALQ